MKLLLELDDDLVLRCARCGSSYVLAFHTLPEPDLVLPGDCASCYHHLAGYLCACREVQDMPKHDCPDWSPR